MAQHTVFCILYPVSVFFWCYVLKFILLIACCVEVVGSVSAADLVRNGYTSPTAKSPQNAANGVGKDGRYDNPGESKPEFSEAELSIVSVHETVSEELQKRKKDREQSLTELQQQLEEEISKGLACGVDANSTVVKGANATLAKLIDLQSVGDDNDLDGCRDIPDGGLARHNECIVPISILFIGTAAPSLTSAVHILVTICSMLKALNEIPG